jgi:hypothetical protein
MHAPSNLATPPLKRILSLLPCTYVLSTATSIYRRALPLSPGPPLRGLLSAAARSIVRQSLCSAAAAFLSLAIGVRRRTSTPFKRKQSEMVATGEITHRRRSWWSLAPSPLGFGRRQRCRPLAVAWFPLGYL